MQKSFTKRLNKVLAIVLTIAALAVGQSVWAMTKTVTYKITSVNRNSSFTAYEIVFTRQNDATRTDDDPFDTSAPTTYTTSVPIGSIENNQSGYFSVVLADGFQLNSSWSENSTVRFASNCIYPSASDKYITYSVSCSNDNYYVTHVMMTGHNSDYQQGLLQPFPNLNDPIDYDYSSEWHFSQSYRSCYAFGQITITYTDVPLLSIFESDGENAYKIKDKYDLRHLAAYVNNGGNNCSGLTFRQTQAIACDGNFTPIGYRFSNSNKSYFKGTYDGQGHTVSGITVSRTGGSDADGCIGLFGYVEYGGTVQNVVLASSTFTGNDKIGGIVGLNWGGTVKNCRVESSVTIKAGCNNAWNHGGIVGYNDSGTIEGCVSAASILNNGKSSHQFCGGITGRTSSTIRDCLYTGTTIEAADYKGAICGYSDGGATYANNYYTAIALGGVGAEGGSSDQDGARRARTVTLGTNVALVGNETTYSVSGLTAIGTSALRYNNTLYSGATQTLNLRYSGEALATGYAAIYSVDGTRIARSTFEVPASNVSVSVAATDVWGVSGTPAADGSADHPYTISSTYGLDLLAKNVNGTDGYTAADFSGQHFLQTAPITYDGTENNYTPIGNSNHYFKGHYDGGGETISGININHTGQKTTYGYKGIFGNVDGGNVHDVVLAESTITSDMTIGGIVGRLQNNGTVQNCRVESTVTINTGSEYSCDHGGIAGSNENSSVIGCLSAATLNRNNKFPSMYGGIVGHCYNGTVKDCLYTGTTVEAQSMKGAIVGTIANGSTLTNNYYSNIDLGAVNGNDTDGARLARTVTLGEHVALVGSETLYNRSGLTAIGTGNYALSHGDGNTTTIYSGATQALTLSYTDEVPGNHILRYKYNDGSDHAIDGNTFAMPNSNVTVTATVIPTSGNCGNTSGDHVTWAVTDKDNDGIYETLTISGTGKMMNYGENGQPWNFYKMEITTAVIGDGVTNIGYYFLSGCTTLTSVNIASSVTSIESSAFDGCTNLATINGASGVTFANYNAFSETAWDNALSDGLTYVGHVAYKFKGDGTSVTLDVATTQIYHNAFRFSSITSIVIPASVTHIGDRAFGNSQLHKVYVLRNESVSPYVPLLGMNVFENCNNLAIIVPADAYNNYDTHWYTYSNCLQRGYTVTCDEGITATASAPIVAKDETVTLGYTIPSGYVFNRFTSTAGSIHNGNILTMEAQDATVSVYKSAKWGINNENDGSETKPYIISSDDELNLLSDCVNGTTGYAHYDANDFTGKYFKMDGFIPYSEKLYNNFITIGTNGKEFNGTFDGNNKVIKSIRITDSSASHQGLFGHVGTSGTVKNVLLEDAVIINPSATSTVGVIAAHNEGTLTDNYYFGCKINIDSLNIGTSGGDVNINDGAVSMHIVTPGEGVVVTGSKHFYINDSSSSFDTGDNFYPRGSTITLSPAEGYLVGSGYTATKEKFKSNNPNLDPGSEENVPVTENAGVYSFTMPAGRVVVGNLEPDIATYWHADADHDGTSEARAYIISNTTGLDILASHVNYGDDCSGVFFRQGNDIAYDPNITDENGINFQGIGGGFHTRSGVFSGSFDGQGYTISGIRINRTQDDVGLFGKVDNVGTVKNVILSDARITGGNYTGGIVGTNNGFVKNCVAVGTTIIKKERYNYGVIVGMTSRPLSNNYYFNCSLGGKYDDIGIGNSEDSDDEYYNDGAIPVSAFPLLCTGINDHVFATNYNVPNKDFTIAGRTLYKDGDWNTLCLPFSLSAEQIAAHERFAGADIRALSSASVNDGTLTLNFTAKGAVTSIQAGVPYIVRWDRNPEYEDMPSAYDIKDATFTGVTISSTTPGAVTSTDGKVTFQGIYGYTEYTNEDRSVLFLGTQNRLYYPQPALNDPTQPFDADYNPWIYPSIGAFRAYFKLNDTNAPNLNIVLNFDDETTGVRPPSISPKGENTEASPWGGLVGVSWYDLSGRKLDQQPTQKGVYIVNGKKVVIK